MTNIYMSRGPGPGGKNRRIDIGQTYIRRVNGDPSPGWALSQSKSPVWRFHFIRRLSTTSQRQIDVDSISISHFLLSEGYHRGLK